MNKSMRLTAHDEQSALKAPHPHSNAKKQKHIFFSFKCFICVTSAFRCLINLKMSNLSCENFVMTFCLCDCSKKKKEKKKRCDLISVTLTEGCNENKLTHMSIRWV